MNDLLARQFYKQRKDFEVAAKKRNSELTMPEGIIEQTDIPYADDNEKVHRMDIYRPENAADKKLPVIINVYGGGLLLGNKEFNRFFCGQLCTKGYLVFSIEYGLVPDCQVYDQFNDVSMAFKYIKSNLSDYNGNLDHIYGVADSGGGYLLAYTAAMAKCHKLAKAAHVKPHDISFNALTFISGMFYTTKFDKIGLCLPKYLYGKNYKKKKFAPYLNPEHPDIVTSLPPCFLVTSKKDNLKRYTFNFEKALARHDVLHKLKCFPADKRLTHAFSVFSPELKESHDTVSAIDAFFRKYK